MKQIVYILVFSFLLTESSAQGPCRPRLCLVDYSGHNDNMPNSDMSTIQSVGSCFVIDNTPGGYWGGQCLPSLYISSGVKIFSYITAGYEGTRYGTTEDALSSNLGRVDAIYADGAYGVMLDEVDALVASDTAKQNYIAAIYNRCHMHGLKLMLNPGTYSFDTFLVSHSDYIITDEHYNGTRHPSTSEMWRLDSVVVLSLDAADAATAAAITDSARANGFGYSYACDTYNILPSWLISYTSMITLPTATPVVSVAGTNLLRSSSSYGNQWYKQGVGILMGETGQNLNIALYGSGTYYDIVSLSGCSSDTSNKQGITVTTSVSNATLPIIKVYPNPTNDIIHIEHVTDPVVSLYYMSGRLCKTVTINGEKGSVSMDNIPNGSYIIEVVNRSGERYISRVVKE